MAATWKQTNRFRDPLVYEKEILPEGEIVPFVDAKQDVAVVTVKKAFLENLVEHFKKFKEVGTRVPLFKSHVEDADNERGLVEDLYLKPNAKGKTSAFAKVRFHDKKAAEQGTKVDVSVFVPKRFRDGRGNIFNHALQHLALTSRPICPALAGWEGPLILSFDTPSGLMLAADAIPSSETPPYKRSSEDEENDGEGNTKMSELIDQILEALGLSAPEGADDIAKLQLILHDCNDSANDGEEETGDMALSQIPVVMTNQFRKSREAEIDCLVREEVITPARGAEWKKTYGAKTVIETDLRLSAEESETGETEFDRLVKEARAIASDRPKPAKGATTLRLGRDPEAKDSPLVARAKAHREETRQLNGSAK